MAGNQQYLCSFEFEGMTYNGHIVSSTSIEPHFYWFMFKDEFAIRKYGDSIAFKMQEGRLVPLYHLTAPGFVAAVQQCVENMVEEHYRQTESH
jgi:hypothetical protein